MWFLFAALACVGGKHVDLGDTGETGVSTNGTDTDTGTGTSTDGTGTSTDTGTGTGTSTDTGTGTGTEGTTDPPGPERAMWVWSPPFGDASGEDALVAMAVDDGFNCLYLSDYTPAKEDHALLAKLHAEGIRVVALAGDPKWAEDTTHGAAHTAAIAAFDAGGESFDAIQHDTEFYLLDSFDTDRAGTVAAYLDSIRAAKKAADIPYTVALPFWLHADEYAAIADEVDGTAIMSYRDTSTEIVSLSTDEVAYGVPAIVGLQLSPSGEGDYTTFAEEGRAALVTARDEVEADFAGQPGFAGTAVEDETAWETSLP